MPKTYAEIVADEIRAAGYSTGGVGYTDADDRAMWAADARREDGHHCIARGDSELGAWVALKGMIWEADRLNARSFKPRCAATT